MTVPTARRQDHVRAALIQLVEIVGDDQRIEHHFSTDDERFAGFLETTWRNLLDAGFVELRSRFQGGLLVLTPSGWITGMRLSGRLHGEVVRERAQRIVRSLKARVKGRHGIHDELVDVRDLARELDIPVGWLVNAMEAKLLDRVFAKDRMKLRYDKLLVRIPPTFGSEPVEID
jgi:hypothetical protein